MITLAWNCSGLGHGAAIPFLCELVRVQRPDVIFLSETLCRANKIEELRVRLHYECALSVDCVGRSGGLCVLWKTASLCNILSYSQNYIDIKIVENDRQWRLTGFYGFPKRARRRLSWDLLRRLAGVDNSPWVIIGDFNDILSCGDKCGGAPHPNWLFQGFREAIGDCNVSDIQLLGHQFTWCRRRTTSGLVEERLDRAMASPQWHALFLNAKLNNLVSPISNHSPILLNTTHLARTTVHRRFQFENKWLEKPEIERVISVSWRGFGDFDILKRLRATSEVLGDWGKHIAYAWNHNKQELENEIKLLQSSSNGCMSERYVEARNELAKLLISEEHHWKQRAKAHWLVGGDLNTRFFHQMATARRRRNKISGLLNDRGEIVDDRLGTERLIRDYFVELFTPTESLDDIDQVMTSVQRQITEVDNEMLVAHFDHEEFRIAISQMHKDKSPGPDGFNPGFYKKFWGIVGPDIVAAAIQWLESGIFPESLNETNVALIPKCDSPKTVKDLRPISLCNVVYKIISKVLCNRLKRVLPSLVDESQSAFITGRLIQDNVLIAFVTIHSMKRKRQGRNGDVALKIDISKAYDRVDWQFLDSILQRMGFHEKWLGWMRMCVQTVTYSFIVNDNLVGPIVPGRGLRQGDPLSPYLFILCAEGLSSLLHRENGRGRLHGCRVSRRAPAVSHLQFADDSLLFCKASSEECRTMKATLDLYERASGQAINYSKSGIFFSSNVHVDLRSDICGILGVSNPLNTGRYLGLPSLIGRGKVEIFSYIKDRLWSKLQGWRNKKISKAGKEVLIKSAAQAIPAYCMSTFLLPPTLLDSLHRMMNVFWWNHGSNPKKGVKWESWEKLCKHKNASGMGFINLHIFNIAMLGKLGWRLITEPTSLVSRVLKAKYYPNTDFLQASLGSSPSFTWRSIHSARELLNRGVRWKIGDGTNVKMWGDPWLADDASFMVHTPPVSTFEDMIIRDFFVPETREWDVELINEMFTEDDSIRILKTTPAPADSGDRLIWHFSSSGHYTVKSAYRLAMNIIADDVVPSEEKWKLIWKVKMSPRIKSFYWRLCRGFLPVRAKLGRWYPGTSIFCPMCADCLQVESIWHTFLVCPFAKSCWDVAGLWRKLDMLCYDVDSHSELFQRVLSEFSMEEVEKVLSISWAIWRARNQLIWEGTNGSPAKVVHAAAHAILEWKEVRVTAREVGVSNNCSRWHPPPVGFVKINIDASFEESSFVTGVGMVLRLMDGTSIAFRTLWKKGLLRTEEGEAWGVLEAIKWAREFDYQSIIFETDAQRVRDAYLSDGDDITAFGDFIKVCKGLLSLFPNSYVRCVSRNANVVAQSLARAARRYESPYYWTEHSSFVDDLTDICLDCK